MGVWIRTQNKEELVETGRVFIIHDLIIKGVDVRGQAVTLRNL